MVNKARQMGLDKGPKYEELMRARIAVLTKELNESLQDEAGRVSEEDAESYYQKNQPTFQEADLQRIYIPAVSSRQKPKTKPAARTPRNPAGIRRGHEEAGRRRASTGCGGRRFRQAAG